MSFTRTKASMPKAVSYVLEFTHCEMLVQIRKTKQGFTVRIDGKSLGQTKNSKAKAVGLAYDVVAMINAGWLARGSKAPKTLGEGSESFVYKLDDFEAVKAIQGSSPIEVAKEAKIQAIAATRDISFEVLGVNGNLIKMRTSPLYKTCPDTVTVKTYLAVARQLLKLSQLGFSHSDLHTGNILVSKLDQSDVKLIDFEYIEPSSPSQLISDLTELVYVALPAKSRNARSIHDRLQYVDDSYSEIDDLLVELTELYGK